jgi:hypothetical protein
MKKYPFIAILVTLFPTIAFAQTTSTLQDVITKIAGYLNSILALLMGLAVVMFVFYIVRYFIQPNVVERAEASKYVMWSLLGFFVILSFWGIVNILISTFSFGQNSPGTWNNFANIFPTGTDSTGSASSNGNGSNSNSPFTSSGSSYGGSVSNPSSYTNGAGSSGINVGASLNIGGSFGNGGSQSQSGSGNTATCGGTSYPPDGNAYVCNNGYWDQAPSSNSRASNQQIDNSSSGNTNQSEPNTDENCSFYNSDGTCAD